LNDTTTTTANATGTPLKANSSNDEDFSLSK
jgi:hypothetical protein